MKRLSIIIALYGSALLGVYGATDLLRVSNAKSEFKVAIFTDLHYGESLELDSQTDKVSIHN